MLNKFSYLALALVAVPAIGLTIGAEAAHSAPVPTTTAAGLQELDALVDARLVAARTERPETLWEDARSLRDAAGLLQAESHLNELLDARLAPEVGLTGGPLLFAAAARLVGGAPDLELISTRVLALLDDADPAIATGAAQLLGRQAFRGLGAEERSELAATLQKKAEEGDLAPSLRIAAAVGSYEIGRGINKGKARARLRSFLGSEDSELRAKSALALAEIGDEVRGELEDELAALAELPGDSGRLAESYLKLEATRQMHEDKYRKLQTLYNAEAVPEDLRRVANLMEMIHDGHLEGDRFSEEELIDAGLNGMLQSLDEHSSYMTPDEYKKFSMDLLEENYGGIGAYVRNDPADNIFTITRPIYSGPAYKAGLATDDKIVRIDDWPTIGNETEEVIKRLKGKPGTPVKLYIWRRGMDPGLISRPTDAMIVEIVRAQISVPSTAYQMLPGKIGLVELRSFSRNATEDMGVAIDALLADGMKGLIFDLRFDSGGLLTEARGVADLFLPKGLKVVTTEARVGPSQVLMTESAPLIPAEMPVACLINRYSASASEIVSGALQDHARATLIGERSFGKGSVQNLFELYGYRDDQFIDENGNHKWDPWEKLTRDFNENGEFDFAPHVRLTIARYLLPSGRSIHREFDREHNLINPGGVVPDTESNSELIEGWRLVERRALLENPAVRDYVDAHWDAHHEEFAAFALCDEKNPQLYPDFDSFYASLETPLDTNDVRVVVRAEIRRRVQDDRGGAFPFGDFEEDVQVQDAVRNLFDSLGQKVADFPAYATTFTSVRNEDGSHAEPVAALDSGEEKRVDGLQAATRALIAARDTKGSLAGEDLAGLIEMLEGLTRDQ